MRTPLATPLSMPRHKIVAFVQKRSSPTSSIFDPSSSVSNFQPSQSFSHMPSSKETMGYCSHQDVQSAAISSEVFSAPSDLKNTYLPSCHISLVAGSRQSAMSSPGREPAVGI